MTSKEEKHLIELLEKWNLATTKNETRVLEQLNKLAVGIHKNLKNKSLDYILGLEE